jgi:hypothetical protein
MAFIVPLEVSVDCWPFGSVTVTLADAPNGKPVIVTTSVVAEVTATVALPDFVVSSVEVAVIVAVPTPAGVKTPVLLTAPMLVGLTDHVTEEL